MNLRNHKGINHRSSIKELTPGWMIRQKQKLVPYKRIEFPSWGLQLEKIKKPPDLAKQSLKALKNDRKRNTGNN